MSQSLATAQILTTADFHARVLALSPKIAVFDCDGTLWSGDAGSTFMWWTMENGILSPEQITWMNDRYDGYKRGEVSELAICGEMVQVYRGIPVATLRAAAAEFFATRIEQNIFPEMLELIQTLQANGCDIWAVSSTNDWVIEEGVRRFNIPPNRVLCARVAIGAGSNGEGASGNEEQDGIIAARLLDVPTDEGKVASLRRAGITAPDAVFGNSVHDAAMLAIARSQIGIGGSFPVNPTPALIQHSIDKGWPIYYPASVTPNP